MAAIISIRYSRSLAKLCCTTFCYMPLAMPCLSLAFFRDIATCSVHVTASEHEQSFSSSRFLLGVDAAYCKDCYRRSSVVRLSVTTVSPAKRLNPSRCWCGLRWAQGTMYYTCRLGCTLALPGEYGWTVRVLRRCGASCQITSIACWYIHLAASTGTFV